MKETEPVYQAIAARIRMLRDTLDVSQEDLAKRTGIKRASIASIETGRQRVFLHDIEKIAKALGTSPKNIMKGIWI